MCYHAGLNTFISFFFFSLLHRRKKQALPQTDSSADPTDIIIEDQRKGFTFDDPYQSIDISDDVKTLSSAESGDSAFDTSPNDSGQDIRVNGNTASSTVNNNKESSNSPPPAVNASSDNDQPMDEPVYEMIAFEHDGGVNHNPTSSDVASSLRQDCDVSDQSLPTYEVVGNDVEAPKTACSSLQKQVAGVDPCSEDDDVFEGEPLYAPVYESLYVDCLSSSQGRKDSGVVLEMVPSPTESTHRGTTTFCKSRNSNALSESPESADTAQPTPSAHWDSIKFHVNELRRLKRSASLPHAEGSGESPGTRTPDSTDDRKTLSPHTSSLPNTARVLQSSENPFSYTSPNDTAKLATLPLACHGDSTNTSTSALEDFNGSPQGIPLSSQPESPRETPFPNASSQPETAQPLQSSEKTCSYTSPEDTAKVPSLPLTCHDDPTNTSSVHESCDDYPQGIPLSPQSDGASAAVSPRKSSVQSQDGTECPNSARRGSKPPVPPKPPRKK